MRILTVSPIFPGRATPHQGVFIKERQIHLPDEADVSVLRMRPWFPGAALFLSHLAGDVPEREEVCGLPVRDVRYRYIPRFFKHRDGDGVARALRRVLAAEHPGPELVDAHFAYPTGYGAWRAASEAGLPVCITLRGTITAYARDRRREKMAEALRGATRLIAVSSSLARAAREVAEADLDVRVIPNGVDTDLFRPGDRAEARAALGLPAEGPVLLTVGGLVPRKGVGRVLDVLPELLRSHPTLTYVVVGGGGVEGDHERALRARAAEGDLAGRVRLVGAVDHAALPEWYRAADVFVLSTSNEGWANVLQESLACGTPCVTTDVGGNREVLGDCDGGIVVPFGDAGALGDAVGAALSRTWDRDAIAAWGRRRDWHVVGREVWQVYEEAVHG